MNFLKRIPEFQLDVLKEVGNIGAGNAATALSILLDKTVDMRVPKVNLLPIEAIPDYLGSSEQVVVAIYMRVNGDAPGNMFFILNLDSAKKILRQLAGFPVSSDGEFTEMELSALNEIGNILAGSYLSSLADFTRLKLHPDVPALAMDMIGSILSFGLIQFGQMGDYALFIDTVFREGKDQVEGHFFFIPDPDSFKTIFSALGVPLE